MSTTVDLNADMGESFGPWVMGNDLALLDVVSSANIACGFHAGDADVMAAPEGSQAFFDALGSKDKTLDFWPGLYHEIFNEPESEEVMTRYVSWLQARL